MSDQTDLRLRFDKDGNCKTLGDPYREPTNTAKLIFDEEGSLRDEAEEVLEEIIQGPVNPMCDAVQILCAARFARKTKGNYSAIYYWR